LDKLCKRYDGPLPECLRFDRAGFPEGSQPESNGSTQTETAFLVVQLFALALFVVLFIFAAIRFPTQTVRTLVRPA
jgi:flagellar biogenesis protein FliO